MEDAAEFKKDLKKQLVSALAQVKLRAPGHPDQQKEPKPQLQFMAYLAGKRSAVIVARSVGQATKKLLPDIAGCAGGGKFVQGECVFEQSTHTFILEQVLPGLAKMLAKALLAATGQKYKVRVRSHDGSVTIDSDTDTVPEEVPPPPTAPVAAADEMARFTARFKALQPNLIKAIATKTSRGDEAKRRAMEAGALANKKDFAKANQLLDVIEDLLKQAGAATTPTTPPAAPTTDGPFQKAWAAARSNLHEAVDTVRDQLAAFATALMAGGEQNLIWIAEEGLSQVFSSLRESAVTIDRATSKLPARVVFKAQPAIEILKKQISTPRVLACDQNKLGVSVTIRDTMAKAIQELEAALALAKA